MGITFYSNICGSGSNDTVEKESVSGNDCQSTMPNVFLDSVDSINATNDEISETIGSHEQEATFHDGYDVVSGNSKSGSLSDLAKHGCRSIRDLLVHITTACARDTDSAFRCEDLPPSHDVQHPDVSGSVIVDCLALKLMVRVIRVNGVCEYYMRMLP